MVEGIQQIARTEREPRARGCGGRSYPGPGGADRCVLPAAIVGANPSPTRAEHLLRVTELFEQRSMTEVDARPRARQLRRRAVASRCSAAGGRDRRARVSRRASRAGARRVRGIGRAAWHEDLPVHNGSPRISARPFRPDALAGADVVIHAAAETAGGYDAHQRNTVDATRHLLHAMHARRRSSAGPREQPVGSPAADAHRGKRRTNERRGPATRGRSARTSGASHCRRRSSSARPRRSASRRASFAREP